MSTKIDKDDSFYLSHDTPSLVSHEPSPYQSTSTADQVVLEEEWRAELARTESEILTLTSVLRDKQRRASELKRNLGISTLQELKRDLEHGVQNLKESEMYKNTNDKLVQIGETISNSATYQKTNDAFKSLGSYASKKLEDLRNSDVYKSVEEKVGDAYTSVKTTLSMSVSRSGGNVSSNDSVLDDDEVYSSNNHQRTSRGYN